MCLVCSMTQNFDPSRHDNTDQAFALITEISDAADDMSTVYSMSVGDTFSGNIEQAYDDDWVAITLQAGTAYQIDALGQLSGGGTLYDTYLKLFDANGLQLAFNDDGGEGFEAKITFTAETTGTYYIEASGYSSRMGTYQLTVSEQAPLPVASLDQLALQLTDGYWGNRQYTWDTSVSNVITVNLSALTAEGQKMARWAMEAWEMVADLDFVEVSSGEMLTLDDSSSTSAWAYAPGGSDVNGVEMNVGTGWIQSYGDTMDSYSFQTYIHELGHAIGLGHQGNYNGGATYGQDNLFVNDSWQTSVMSYFSQAENTTVNASYAFLITSMQADIIAAQNLYGAAGEGSATYGNTTWGAGSNLGNYLDAYFAGLVSGESDPNIASNASVAFTIFDAAGDDTLNLTFTNAANRVDLAAESFSDVAGLTGNVAIARGTTIENLLVGNGNDTVSANEVGNRLITASGNDSVTSLGGDDTIYAGAGDDTIFAGTGHDWISGGDQGDLIYGEEGNDTVLGGNGMDLVYLGEGDDRFVDNEQTGVAGRDTVFAANGDDTILGGGGNDAFFGGAGEDSIQAGDGDDRVFGGDQADIIFGGAGNDTVDGGNGLDVVYLNTGNDVFNDNTQNAVDRVYGGWGNDTINANGGNDILDGQGGRDVINGGSGNDQIFGGSQDDRITGGDGHDTITGGTGRDQVWMNIGHDVFIDDAESGPTGNDTVYGGWGMDTITASGGDDQLFGQGDSDQISGGGGNDWIDGGLANDTLNGGDGSDTFVFATGFGNDVIEDFSSEDVLRFSSSNWSGSLTESQVVSSFASQTADGVAFDFGGGHSVLLENLSTLSDLDTQILIF